MMRSLVRCLLQIHENFCCAAGQKINFAKSKFYASPSVARRDIIKFSAICGMTVTNDLDIYLGKSIVTLIILLKKFKGS